MLFALMIVGAIVIVTVLVVGMLRGWGKDVERAEAAMHDPGTRTIDYDVPPGRDPAALLAALKHAGYTAIEENPGRLVVACPQDGDDLRVRDLLARV